MKKKKHASGAGKTGASSASRDVLSRGGENPTFPSVVQSSPYRTCPYPLKPGRSNQGPGSYASASPSSWEAALSPAFDDLGESFGHKAPLTKAEHKRRELGWITSFPAEYHHAHQTRDFQQTLAYQDQFNQRQRNEQVLTHAVVSGAISTIDVNGPKATFPNASSPNWQELELLKQVTMREGTLEKLKELAHLAAAGGFQADTGSEVLQLLLQLRDASVAVVSAMSAWHQSTASRSSRPPAFLYKSRNYSAKMVSDLNFLAGFSSLGRVLGVDPARMKQNPFMMPSPIPEREFVDVESLSASTPPRFTFADSVERVAEAEKYLVWSLVNLPEGIGNPGSSYNSDPGQEAPPPPQQSQQSPLSSQGKRELLTWQQRAELQLRLLSMPLESPTGQARLMDSSRMMKRKGFLPSLPQSPPKTLTQLMENVHKGGYTSPTNTNCFSSFEIVHDGNSYRMTALDAEMLGSNEAPPHAIVTLVAASVLILLSPSDRIPKDLSWASCQKMLASGIKLIQRVEDVDVDSIPPFKWKALLPFLQNEYYDPMFLMEYSCAAATLCAWVLGVLERAQHNDRVASKVDEDERELLEELEQDEQELPPPMALDVLRPLSRGTRSSSSKRVSIGNAEVLFINENEPVSPLLAASRETGSRPPSSASISMAAAPRRQALLRTSPWTHHGVTYFVSFFLEKSDDEPREMLSIKMYEPMSSVESQMFVSPNDLLLDFGVHAAEYFQRREFGMLCDLILTQLDGLMAPMSRGGLSCSWRRPSKSVDPSEQTSEDVVAAAARIQNTMAEQGSVEQDKDDAAVRIQSIARQKHARKRVEAIRDQRDASLRIQCAVRQRHARTKVHHVRFTKQHELEQKEMSATKIQSIARQQQAKKRVAHIKLLQRTPTGLPPREAPQEDDDDEDDEQNQRQQGQDQELEQEPEQDQDRDQDQDQEQYQDQDQGQDQDQDQREDQEELRVVDRPPTRGGVRPETSMSYGSEQFEEDFEDE